MIVVDASVLAEALVGQTDEAAERLMREDVLHGPELLPLEVASVLRRLALDSRLSPAAARVALDAMEQLPLRLHGHGPLLPRIWELRRNLTVYDAAYVAVAEALDLPLLTADRGLAKASGPRCSIEVL